MDSRKSTKNNNRDWNKGLIKKHVYKPSTLKAAEKAWTTRGVQTRVDQRHVGGMFDDPDLEKEMK